MDRLFCPRWGFRYEIRWFHDRGGYREGGAIKNSRIVIGGPKNERVWGGLKERC